MKRQCKAKKRNGERCPNPAGESGYCFTHDPARAAERAAARKLGGFNRRTAARVAGDEPIKISSLSDVLKLINAVIVDTWQQNNGAARSRALLACADAAIKVLTMTDIETRVNVRLVLAEPRALILFCAGCHTIFEVPRSAQRRRSIGLRVRQRHRRSGHSVRASPADRNRAARRDAV